MLALVLLALASAVACSSPAAVQSQSAAAAPVINGFLRECAIPDVEGRVLCGSFEVAENRTAPGGRRIPLNVVVLKATGAHPRADPVVPLTGGPGQAATPLAAMNGREFAELRRDRDIVLIDVRGTGRSNPLYCDLASPQWLRSADLMPLDAIRACRDTLQERADLRQYTTRAIAEDLDELRRALGADQWNVFGVSYGTRLAQEYTRAFGAHVRTLTLHGVAAPAMAIPLPYARDAQATVETLFDDEARADLAAALARLTREPAVVPAAAGEVMISAGLFAETLRHILYNAARAPSAAAMVRAAAAGDFTGAAEEIVGQRRMFSHDIALGLFLSVTCAEDIPRIDEPAIAAATRGTFLGEYRVRQQMAACRTWPAGPAAADAATPLASAVPALLISGEVDPVTPPRMGDEVARTLSNSAHVVLAGHGHTLAIGHPCLRAALRQFIDTASPRALDLSCVARVTRP